MHLIARFEQGEERQVERLDTPLRDHHLLRACAVAVAPGDFLRQGFAQLGNSGVGGVAGKAHPRGPVGGLDDVFGGREVRLPHLEVDGFGSFQASSMISRMRETGIEPRSTTEVRLCYRSGFWSRGDAM